MILLGKKIEEIASKIYKPEILNCPFCGASLKYKYTVSNKVVQFTSGKYFRIKNLGYGCINCLNHKVYFSQTANKLAFKGYTYSSKIVCMIAYYKRQHLGREAICDILASKGIEISDRNIDILYKKFQEVYQQDYDTIIKESFQNMLDTYKEIRVSIDVIAVNEYVHILVYDYFTSKLLALWIFDGITDENIRIMLSKYIYPKQKITVIATIRNTKDNRFIPILKDLAPKAKLIAFNKF